MALKRPKFERAAWREWLIILAPVALLVIGAFALTSRFITPAPPNTITITTGGESGAYYKFAQHYRDTLKLNGIALEIKTSAGSMQNLERLWHWYDELKNLERAMINASADREKHVAEIARIDEAVTAMPVPLSYSEQYYNLRSHVEYVRRRLDTQMAVAPAAG